jgi:hypothetical protein
VAAGYQGGTQTLGGVGAVGNWANLGNRANPLNPTNPYGVIAQQGAPPPGVDLQGLADLQAFLQSLPGAGTTPGGGTDASALQKYLQDQQAQAATANAIGKYNAQSQADLLRAQLGEQAAQYGLTQQGYGLNLAEATGQHNLAQQGFNLSDQSNFLNRLGLGLQGQQMDITQAGIGAQGTEAQRQAGLATQQLYQNAGAAGNTVSKGTLTGLSNIQSGLQYTMGNLFRQLQDLAINRQQLQLSYGQQGITEGRTDLSRAQENLQYGYGQQQTGLAQQQAALSYGIGQQSTQASLNQLLNELATPGAFG